MSLEKLWNSYGYEVGDGGDVGSLEYKLLRVGRDR